MTGPAGTATRQGAADYLTLLRKLMSTKLSQSTAFALLEESADWIECLVLALGDQEATADDELADGEIDDIMTDAMIGIKRWVAANVPVPFAPPARDDAAGLFPYPDLVGALAAGALTVPDALPMPAVDGDLCGWTNPENVWQHCSAASDHPEARHAVHGAKGRVVEFWPADPTATITQAAAEAVVGEVIGDLASVIPPGAIPPVPAALPPMAPADEQCLAMIVPIGHSRSVACTAASGHPGPEHVAHDRDGRVILSWEPVPVRPASWVCTTCQGTFPGRKPEDGRCIGCPPAPFLASVPDLAAAGE